MKPDFTLINDYLRRYYEGNTTPAENAMLLSMLEAADDSELTPELRMEREILRAVCDSGIKLRSEIDIPAGLEQRLLDATIGEAQADESDGMRRRRTSGLLYRLIAAAAAVVLVLGISWRFFSSRSDMEPQAASPVRVAEAAPGDTSAIPDVSAAALPEEHLIAEASPVVRTAKTSAVAKSAVRPVSVSNPEVEVEGNTIMITEQADSLEAMRVTLLALQTIDRAMNKVGTELAPAAKSIEESNRQIENTAQIIKNSLI
ncbi:MAG TPA: hypothetical protein DCE24_06085 [Porphyromonadaceae bacterium]|nr:hypothetical protein [Paramuribaculum sp.]HAB41409.1 hypothetical protein [Porphyromonadaceae bacterium]